MQDKQYKRYNARAYNDRAVAYIPYILIRFVSHDKEEKAKHKGIAVVQPIGALHAVPYEVKRRCIEAEHHEENKNRSCDLLAEADLLHEEIQRKKDKGEHSAVNKRPALGTHGIVRSEIHL